MNETLECRLNSTQNKSKNETSNLAGTLRTENLIIIGNDPKSSCKPQRFDAITKEAFENQKLRCKYGDILDDIMENEGKYFRIQRESRKEIIGLYASFVRISRAKKFNLKVMIRKNILLIEKS